MKCIFRAVLVFTFVIGLIGIYHIKTLRACEGGCGEACGGSCGGSFCKGEGHNDKKLGENAVQTKAEVKGEKAEAVKDLVCGMEVSDIKKAPSEEYKGKVYYFCSEHCKKAFKKDPASYIKEKP